MSLESSYFDDVLIEEKEWILSQSLLVFVSLGVLASLVQMYLVFSIVTGCSTVYGLTISGKVFETDSFSCRNPAVASVYQQEVKK